MWVGSSAPGAPTVSWITSSVSCQAWSSSTSSVQRDASMTPKCAANAGPTGCSTACGQSSIRTSGSVRPALTSVNQPIPTPGYRQAYETWMDYFDYLGVTG